MINPITRSCSFWSSHAENLTKLSHAVNETVPDTFLCSFTNGPKGDEKIIQLPTPTLYLLDKWNSAIEEIIANSDSLYTMDWRKFEDLVAHLLDKFGWTVEPMGYTKDDGIDIIAVRRVEPGIDIRMMVQCKRYARNRKIEMDFVRQLWATKSEYKFHQGMIVTTSSFTRGAKQKAGLWRLDLKDHDSIVEWCEKYIQFKASV